MPPYNQIIEFSTTAGDNTDITAVSIAEHIPPSNVNNAMRGLAKMLADAEPRAVTKTTGTYSPAKTDHNQFWRCTGAVTLTPAAAATLTSGWKLWVRANGGAVTINPDGAETIDGGATLVIPDGGECLILCTGTEFFTMAFGMSPATLQVPPAPGGRLTLTTGTPVSTSDVTGTTIYYTPYVHDIIHLYDGSAWKAYRFTERSLALGTLTSNLPYDVFIYDNAGTLTLELTAWTNTTTRATALVRQDGVLCKTGVLTRRYLGTIHTVSTTQTEDSLTKRCVWNMYNRVRRPMFRRDGTSSWVYSSTTIRQANGAAGNQFEMVRGLDEDAFEGEIVAVMFCNTAGGRGTVGFGLDSTTAYEITMATTVTMNAHAANVYMPGTAVFKGLPGLGRHLLTWLESTTGGGPAFTWQGNNGGGTGLLIAGMHGSVMA